MIAPRTFPRPRSIPLLRAMEMWASMAKTARRAAGSFERALHAWKSFNGPPGVSLVGYACYRITTTDIVEPSTDTRIPQHHQRTMLTDLSRCCALFLPS